MKRLLAILALVLMPLGAHAQAPTELWKIEKFSVELNVRTDGYVEVTETINANFLQPRHGIFRYVPEKGTFSDGNRYDLGITFDGVTVDGAPASSSESHENGNVAWKIGDADRTLTGAHVYVITYHARNAIGRYDDHDELYWNVSGDGWDAPLPVIVAKVLAPEHAPADKINSLCYTGAYGSKSSDCTIVGGGTIVGMVTKSPGEPLTVVVGWPKGLVAKPPVDFRGIILPLVWWIIPILTLLFMYRKWQKDGKDKDLGPIVAQYEPAEGLTPAHMVSLMKQAPDNTISATIVNLAVKGYLDIEEIPESSFSRLLTGRDYKLVLKKDFDSAADVTTHERSFLSSVFASSSAGGSVTVASLKNVFYKSLPGLNLAVMADLVEDGYFSVNPIKTVSNWRLPGLVLLVLAAIILFRGGLAIPAAKSFFLPLVSTGLVFVVFGRLMVKWTDKGDAAAWKARGFKEFVTKVEKYRGPWMAEQNMFEKVLPYAMAFGVGTKWAKAFDGLAISPPQWYHGPNNLAGGFVASRFIGDLDHFSSDFNRAVMTRPNQRGSGSGFSSGGGFSGGGGGGGGGGSW